MSSEFVHCHAHTDGSLLDGVVKVKDLVKKSKDLGMSAVAVTDHGVMTNAVRLYKECAKAEIKALIGCEFYLSPTDDHTLREKLEGLPDYYHLTVLAKNEDGVRDLYELSSRGHDEGLYYKPRVSFPMIEAHKNNLIVLGACVRGPVNYHLWKDQDAEAEKWIARLYEALGEDFYLELMDHGFDWQKPLNVKVEALAKRFGIKCVATNDAHFLNREDHYIHCLVMALQLGLTYEAFMAGDTMKYSEECYVKSPDEMREIFSEDHCRNTLEVAEKINVKMTLDVASFPKFLI